MAGDLSLVVEPVCQDVEYHSAVARLLAELSCFAFLSRILRITGNKLIRAVAPISEEAGFLALLCFLLISLPTDLTSRNNRAGRAVKKLN